MKKHSAAFDDKTLLANANAMNDAKSNISQNVSPVDEKHFQSEALFSNHLSQNSDNNAHLDQDKNAKNALQDVDITHHNSSETLRVNTASPSKQSFHQVRDILIKSLEGLSDEERQHELQAQQRQAQKQRQYWQKYIAGKKRVFGMISKAEFQALVIRAEAYDRTPFRQLWAESQAFLKGEKLPSKEIIQTQKELVLQLRHIGNNINQLAKLGHIEARKHGKLIARDESHLGVEAMRQFTRLEQLIMHFDDEITLSIKIDEVREDGS